MHIGYKNVFSSACVMNIQASDAFLELFLNSLGGFLDITTVVCINYILEIFHPMESSGLKGQHQLLAETRRVLRGSGGETRSPATF